MKKTRRNIRRTMEKVSKALVSLTLSACMTVSGLTPFSLAEVFAADQTVTFENTEGWSSVYAYTYKYDESNGWVEQNGSWPGTAMTLTDNKCSFTIPDGYEVIFNDGTDETEKYQPISENDTWSYFMSSTDNAGDDAWNTLDFDDSTWNTGRGGFGTNNVGASDAIDQTTWNSWADNSSYIFLRKTFNVADADIYKGFSMDLSTVFDEDPVFYLNGHKIFDALTDLPYKSTSATKDRYCSRYYTFKLDKKYSEYLVSGTNVLAVRCENDNGGQRIDAGLKLTKAVNEAHVSNSTGTAMIGGGVLRDKNIVPVEVLNAFESSETTGNYLEFEYPAYRPIYYVNDGASTSNRNTGNTGGMYGYSGLNDEKLGYDVYFSKASNKVSVRVSTEATVDGRAIEVYLDDNDTPIGTIDYSTSTTGGWNNYLWLSTEVTTIPAGEHRVYFKLVSNTSAYLFNLDCFCFDAATENAAESGKTYANVYDADSTATTGNVIEAESTVERGNELNINSSVNGASGNAITNVTRCGTWARYDLYFDRRTTDISIRYVAANYAGGTVNVYLDSMEGKPIAVIDTPPTATTNSWDWVDADGNDLAQIATAKLRRVINQGYHSVYVEYVCKDSWINTVPDDNGGQGIDTVDADYFTFSYTPYVAGTKYEAEYAHSYSQGNQTEAKNQTLSTNFSNDMAIGNMNNSVAGDKAYARTYVNVIYEDNYDLTIGYTATLATTISYRIDSGEWTSLTTTAGDNWDTLKKLLVSKIELTPGIHTIDVTGADTVDNGQWVNLDYVELNNNNLLSGKTLYVNGASSGNPKENATDIEGDTVWQSSENGGWIYADLGNIYDISKVDILFDKAYNKGFEIQVSSDGTTWTTAEKVEDSENNVENVVLSESERGSIAKARYVRVQAVGDWTEPMAIENIKVYGTRCTSAYSNVNHLFLAESYKASSATETGLAKYAVDGKLASSWVSNESNPEYIVKFDKTYLIDSYDLVFGENYAEGFTVSYSTDGENWTEINTADTWTALNGAATGLYNYSYDFTAVEANYIKFKANSLKNEGKLSLVEFEAWGQDLNRSDYWKSKDLSVTPIGVYQVTGLQDTNRPGEYESETIESGTTEDGSTNYTLLYPSGKIDSTLVSGDIISNAEEYTVIYDGNDRNIYFYLNPRGDIIDHTTQTVFWSCGDQGLTSYGAPNHKESIAKFVDKRQATVQYELAEDLDFNGEDYITTDIGAKVYNNSDLTDGVPSETATPAYTIYFTLKIMNAREIYIGDNIKTDGTLVVKNASSNASYVWEKSEDGKTNWQVVSASKNDLTIIKDNGAVINVADDQGGGYYYRVKESGQSTYSAPYKVKYYSTIKNGGFEYPAQSSVEEEGYSFPYNGNGDEQQFPNGYENLYWKTTGPGWDSTYGASNRNMATHDIEIINGRWLKTENNKSKVSGFSVSDLDMYGDTSHGDQFAELNCEAIGSLYQDLLTTPGSECYWDLDHAGRWQQNEMYVIAMATSDASTYFITEEAIEALKTELGDYNITDNNSGTDVYADGVIVSVCARDGDGNMIDKDGNVVTDATDALKIKATVWMAQSSTTAGKWTHHSGKYEVPLGDSNYLTRLFFISKTYSGNNKTVGNLLDNVEFEQKKSYTINYYVYENGAYVLKHVTTGVTSPYGQVEIADTISEEDLSSYTLVESNINKYVRDSDGNITYTGDIANVTTVPYYLSNSRTLTASYDHDTVNLYYRSGVVTVTEIVKGLDELPDGYAINVDIMDGTTVKNTKTLSKSDFTAIENEDGTSSDSYFATYTVDAIEAGLTSGTTYTIKESSVQTFVDTDNYLSNISVYHSTSVSGTADDSKDLTITELDSGRQTYEDKSFTYDVDSTNAETLVNTYVPTHVVTVKNEVTGNMGDVEKSSKKFTYTVTITKDNEKTDALVIGDTVEIDYSDSTKYSTGTYTFELKGGESLDFLVYDGCIVTVVEKAEEYYSTDFSAMDTGDASDQDLADNDRLVSTVSNKTVSSAENASLKTESILASGIGDITILSINDSSDLGDVEVQGFQMNTNTEEGAPSEFSPSFRVVCRVSKNTIHRRKVVKAGVIFGTASVVNADSDGTVPESKAQQKDNAEKNLVFNSEKILDNDQTVGAEMVDGAGKLSENIFFHEETENGYYSNYTTAVNDEHPSSLWNYYALTFNATSYMYGMLNQVLTYRAYAVVEGTAGNYDYIENGKYYKYEYGNDIYTVSMYEIAEDLYSKKKMTSQKAHEYLYNNILNIVTMDNNRTEITKAMMKTLGVTSTADANYGLVNAWYKCAYDYIHCFRTYSYADRNAVITTPNADFTIKEFAPSGMTADECNAALLLALNTKTGTSYSTISAWIYNEVEKVKKGSSGETYYSGYYKLVPYTYDDSIVTDFDEE